MTEPEPDLAELVDEARNGDSRALEQVIDAVQDRIFRLALRMVTQPAEAEDATQEIIIKVITRLASFRGEAAFMTWVHRIAVNHLLDRAKSEVEALSLDFDAYGKDLRAGLSGPSSDPAADLLATEVRLSCTQAMLTCLDREHRIAYVLAEIFEVSSADGAYICDVSSDAYRKRVSRARSRIRSFVGQNCGLINPDAPCRCDRRVETAVQLGRIDPLHLEFSALEHAPRTLTAGEGVSEMEQLHDAASLFRSHPDYSAPKGTRDTVRETVRSLITSGRYRLFTELE